MKKKYIWISIGVILGALVLIKISSSDANDTQKLTTTFVANKVESSLSSLSMQANELGDIHIGDGLVDTEFHFKNTGNEAITILHGETSCMCTKAIIKKKNGEISPRIVMPGHGGSNVRINMTIEPGEEAILLATFDPMAHGPNALGPIQREIMLDTNSTQTPTIQFSFNGNVIK